MHISSSGPHSQTPAAYAPPSVQETKLHTHTQQLAKKYTVKNKCRRDLNRRVEFRKSPKRLRLWADFRFTDKYLIRTAHINVHKYTHLMAGRYRSFKTPFKCTVGSLHGSSRTVVFFKVTFWSGKHSWFFSDKTQAWSQWPRRLRRGSAAACILGLRVRIAPRLWTSVSCEFYALSCRDLCIALITRSKESWTVRCVTGCDCEASLMRSPWPSRGAVSLKKKDTCSNLDGEMTLYRLGL